MKRRIAFVNERKLGCSTKPKEINIEKVRRIQLIFKDQKSRRRRMFLFSYRQTGWIGTVEVNRDTGLEPGETPI